jgi:hypothetical protein
MATEGVCMKLRDYNFATNPSMKNHFGPDWSITRATLGTTYDGYGWLRHIDAGVPRFRGGFYTNNILESDSEDTTGWTSTRVDDTVITDDLPPNFGIKKATQLTSQVTTNNTHAHTTPYFSTIKGRVYLFSFFIKEDGYDEIRADISAAGFPNNSNAFYNTTTGWGTVGAGGVLATGEMDAGNGWKRAWMAQECDETVDTATVGLLLSGPDGEDIIFSGDGTSGIKLTGAMISDVTGQHTENLLKDSEDITQSTWAKTNSTASAADTLTFDTAFGKITSSNAVAEFNSGDIIVFSAIVSGSGTLDMRLQDDDSVTHDATEITLTSTPTRYSIQYQLGTGSYTFVQGVLDKNNKTATGVTMTNMLLQRKRPNDADVSGYVQTGSSVVTYFSAPQYVYTTGTVTGKWDGGALGWEMERARTNLHTDSEDFGQWTQGSNNATFVGNEAIAPDGSVTADLLIDDGLTGTSTNVLFSNPLTYTVSSTYVTGFFLKKAGLDWGRITITSLGALDISAYFDLANGAVGATTGANNDDEGIVDVGNGWYFCWVAYTSDAVDTSGVVVVRPANTDNDSTVARDGTSSIYVWGADTQQTTVNNLNPTNYIRTEGSSQTRNLEAISTSPEGYPGDGIVTAYVRYSTDATNAGMAMNINKGVNDYFSFGTNFNGNSPEVRNYVTTGDDGAMNFNTLTRDRTSFIEIVASCEPGNMVGVESDANGGTTQTDTSVTCFTKPTKFLMNDDFNGGSELDGVVSRVVVWTGAYETAELELMAEDPLSAVDTVVDRKRSRDRFRRRYRRT